jgi:Mrp family chromosome partitioning ATPase
MLRSQVLQRCRQRATRIVGIVGASEGEGKTLTAVSLSLAMAADSNQTVVLVDMDLKHPSVAAVLGIPPDSGLEAWFEERMAVEDLLRSVRGHDRLLLLPTYRQLAGSSELLAARRTHEMLQSLAGTGEGRIVVLDLPPVLLGDDFLALAPVVDSVLLVASQGRTHRDDLQRMADLIGHERIIGTVVNRSSEHERRVY